MPLNIKTRAVLETLEFQLADAEESPLTDEHGAPCMAVIYGPGSRRYTQAQARRQTRMLNRLQRGKSLTETGDEQLRAQAEFLADITERLDLDYIDEDSGAALVGRDKFLAIYRDASVGFVAEQVTKKANDWGNFSKGSPKP